MKNEETDILVIGAGPAGSTAALYLSKLGYQVTLVEKKIFPREILCGEFLSKEVTEILIELNLIDKFLSLKPNKLKSFKAIDDSGIELITDLNFSAHAMKRSLFDSLLLDSAKSRSVDVIQPAEVLKVVREGSLFRTTVRRDKEDKVDIISRFVIGAYGKQNIIDKRLGRSFVSRSSNLNGIKFHLPLKLLNETFSDQIRIYFDESLYCGINQVSDSEVTVCFLERQDRKRLSSRERLNETIRENKYLNNLFSNEAIEQIESSSIYGTGNIFFGKRELVKNGVIMIGDAARVIAPLAGDGIGMAMESAKLLFNVMSDKKLSESTLPVFYSRYAEQYENAFNKRLRTAMFIQNIIMMRGLRKPGFILLKAFPSVLPYLIKFTRKNRENTVKGFN